MWGLVGGKEAVQNRFVVDGNYKYKFNNGFIAMSDTHANDNFRKPTFCLATKAYVSGFFSNFANY